LDGEQAYDTLRVNVLNLAPVVAAVPQLQTAAPGAAVATVVFTATDVEADEISAALSWRLDKGAFTPGAPGGLVLEADACVVNAGVRLCTWRVTGNVPTTEGIYVLQLGVSDEDGGVASRAATIAVRSALADLAFDPQNPMLLPASSPAGASGDFTIAVCASDGAPAAVAALDTLRVDLVPLGSGATVPGTGLVEGDCAVFSFSMVPVNVYSVRATPSGDPTGPTLEDVLVVYDPFRDATAGGGWFYWPGTASKTYPGDTTRFGYMVSAPTPPVAAAGKLLLMRYTENGGAYRLESSALSAPAIGSDGAAPMGWASFDGSGTYVEPGQPLPAVDRAFSVYVEDRDQPGDGVDRFWVNVGGGMGLPPTPADNAASLGGGDIIVPH
jgi:hypothetical protein